MASSCKEEKSQPSSLPPHVHITLAGSSLHTLVTLHSDYCSTAAYLDANVLVTHTAHQPTLIKQDTYLHIFYIHIYIYNYIWTLIKIWIEEKM